jgi:N-acetylglucosaminyldiphosphoundecaprenol N-acetyl-beta-D-mannosaminyltransferase
LNLAAADSSYRDVLNAADFVFADGTGVRWAARLQKVHVKQNMPGTDFVPEMFCAMSDRGRSYFMLGSDPDTIAVAADHARCAFPGWRQAGFCHGYLRDERLTRSVIEQINAARPDVLLVGMGNPLQEQWIHRHRAELNVPVCMGVGGLFDFWSGKVSRSPRWLRRAGHEWIWRLWQQPMSKARRYLIGNPLFLVRVLWERREK